MLKLGPDAPTICAGMTCVAPLTQSIRRTWWPSRISSFTAAIWTVSKDLIAERSRSLSLCFGSFGFLRGMLWVWVVRGRSQSGTIVLKLWPTYTGGHVACSSHPFRLCPAMPAVTGRGTAVRDAAGRADPHPARL